MLLSIILVGLANNYDIQNYIIWVFSAYFAFILCLKILFVYIYLLKYYTFKNYKKRQKIKEIKNENNKFIMDTNNTK